MKKLKHFIYSLFITGFLVSGCQKSDYFINTGKQNAEFSGTVFEYLKSKPGFDSITKIISLAGLTDVFNKENITFFAPADSCVKLTLNSLNQVLVRSGKQEVTRLEQIKPEVWKRQICRYMFKSVKSMNDFPQLDPSNLSAYPGQIYASYQGDLMNVGVIYNSAGGVMYAGYRQLILSYIPSISAPRDYNSWFSVTVASVNVKPTNGYVHVLKYPNHFFGFEPGQFVEDVIDKGINY